MYAIFEDGGKQYRVQEGDLLLIERTDRVGEDRTLAFENVLMVGEGAEARIGTPFVEGARVAATVVEELKMPKVVGVKFKRRKGYMKKFGHRQRMLKVRIEKIDA